MIGSVYLHAPFCARRCFYCDFAVQVRRSADPGPWVEAISAEVERHAGAGRILASPLHSVFVGGGTPSLLGPEAMSGVVRALGRERFGPETDFTAEANPESLTSEVARGWAAAGLRRLSLGVQSFQDPVLRWMGRLHGAEGARRSVEVARAAGIDDLSVDLIFALPPELERDWRADLETALRLGVPHISLYGLTVEPGTGLARAVAEGRVGTAGDEAYAESYRLAHDLLTAEGYRHYEVSNFARPGHESKHNQVYWSHLDYLGLGNSAHSLVGGERFWNLRDWEAYRAAVGGGEDPIAGRERAAGDAARLERIWLGLRTSTGLGEEWVVGTAAESLRRGWVRSGLAHDGPGLRLTVEGWLHLDRLAVDASGALTLPSPVADVP